MIKSIKLPVLISVVAYIFSSCIGSDVEENPRTAQQEQIEINIALEKLESDGLDVDTTESGLYYIVEKAGEGPLLQEGDTCFLEYGGYFLDGTLFDASIDHHENGIWEFVHGEVSFIPGFKEGIEMLNKGAEMSVLIPSDLGYGEMGALTIPPYTSLFFALKLHDLKPKTE